MAADDPSDIGSQPDAPSVDSQPDASEERAVPVEFRGSGSEFFKIWIVNAALTVVTLGIYSAWAKVRSRRYFYGNTRIDGIAFEYLANPIAILKGRIIAFIVLGLIVFTSQFYPIIYGILLGLVFLISPWIIVRALRFNARVSAFRNVRFDFAGSLKEAYRIYVGLTLLIPFTLALLIPLVRARTLSFVFSGHRYGDKRFRDSLTTGDIYRVFLLAFLMLIGLAMVLGGAFLGAVVALGPQAFEPAELEQPELGPLLGVTILIYVVLLSGFAFLESFVTARSTNLLLNSGQVGENVRFRSELRTGPLFRIKLWYGFLSLVTLGLAYPWLSVKLAEYRADCTTVRISGSLDSIVEEAAPAGSAAADQVGEVFDIDFGF